MQKLGTKIYTVLPPLLWQNFLLPPLSNFLDEGLQGALVFVYSAAHGTIAHHIILQ